LFFVAPWGLGFGFWGPLSLVQFSGGGGVIIICYREGSWVRDRVSGYIICYREGSWVRDRVSGYINLSERKKLSSRQKIE